MWPIKSYKIIFPFDAVNICKVNVLYITYMLHYSETCRTNGKYNGLYAISFNNNNTNGRLIFAKISMLEEPAECHKTNNDLVNNMYLNYN